MSQINMKKAEVMGQIKTMPEYQETSVQVKEGKVAIDNPDDFKNALFDIQTMIDDPKEKFVIVTEKLFNYLSKKHKTEYLTYGDPGIKVYKEGTKEDIDKKDNLSAEQYHNYMTKGQW